VGKSVSLGRSLCLVPRCMNLGAVVLDDIFVHGCGMFLSFF
jgi:hypothetical protein